MVGQIERQERRSEMKKNQTGRAHHSQAVTRVPDLTAADALVEEGLDITRDLPRRTRAIGRARAVGGVGPVPG